MIHPARLVHGLLGLMLCTVAVHSRADAESLFVRVQDAMAAPGGRAVITLRTYSTRPVGQGTVCLFFRGANGATPVLGALKGARVFAQADDVIQEIDVRQVDGATVVDLTFASASASINRLEGPFAALFFDVSSEAQPGVKMPVELDLTQSFLNDEYGNAIPLTVRNGELEIRHASAPREVAADVHVGAAPDLPVTLSLQTNEPFSIGSGQIGLRYSSRQIPGQQQLYVDPRHGEAEVKLDGHPGLAFFNVLSTSAGFNNLPGNILSVNILPRTPLNANAQISVELDPALTHLFDKQGNWIPLRLESGVWETSAASPAVAKPQNEQR